jgi:uncharacterized protein YfbU (UPF0304 family)
MKQNETAVPGNKELYTVRFLSAFAVVGRGTVEAHTVHEAIDVVLHKTVDRYDDTLTSVSVSVLGVTATYEVKYLNLYRILINNKVYSTRYLGVE